MECVKVKMCNQIFGVLPSGEQTTLYTISCGHLQASITDYGAHLVSLLVPDKTGIPADVVLGYDDPEVPGEGVWDACETKVVYVAPDQFENLQQRILVDDNDEPVCIPCREMTFEYAEEDASDCHNKLFGRPDFMPWEDWEEPCEGWKVLLQVDSDDADDFCLRFMDEGVMYFHINPDDLSNARFENVRGAMVSM